MRRRKYSLAVTVLTAATLLFSAAARAVDQETILHTFTNGSDGGRPSAGFISDAAGNLYSTTSEGGAFGFGTVFEMTPASGGGWTETVLYNFSGSPDGAWPAGGLTFDAAGNLYGTTALGGTSVNCNGGCGTVFKLTPASSGWTETVLHNFGGGNGEYPNGGVVLDASGNLYGAVGQGGAKSGCGGYSCGLIFGLQPTSSGYTAKTLYTFTGGDDGWEPNSGVVLGTDGSLYGTAGAGGAYSWGTIFKLSPTSGNWHLSVLHAFTGGGDGGGPLGSLTFDASNNIYGVTDTGGNLACAPYGCGVVFKLSPASSGGWPESVLHAFAGGNQGGYPHSGVIFDAAGNLYGTASTLGSGQYGTVFKLTHGANGGWIEGVLHSFGANKAGGWFPVFDLLLDATGNLYGATPSGGSFVGAACDNVGCGTVFELSTSSAEGR
jgi:uncharacterized repeat protein (TIGR03803 family)